MRKLVILMMLALCIGIATTAQATTEYTVLEIVNKLLCLQGLDTIRCLDPYLVDYETYAPGNYTITGYGKQASYNQQAYAYDASGTSTLFDLGAYNNNTKGKLLALPISFQTTETWGLEGVTKGGTFYSEQSKNSDDVGHWKLYCLKPLGYDIGFAAFEDLFNGGDKDYNDLVLKIEPNPAPTPIPGSLLLLGSGMIVLLGLRRKMAA